MPTVPNGYGTVHDHGQIFLNYMVQNALTLGECNGLYVHELLRYFLKTCTLQAQDASHLMRHIPFHKQVRLELAKKMKTEIPVFVAHKFKQIYKIIYDIKLSCC